MRNSKHAPTSRPLRSALTAVALLAACSAAPRAREPLRPGDDLRPALARKVREAMSRHGVPGVAVALVDAQEVVAAEGFGVADDHGTPVGPDTLFRVGSVSKPFTALEVVRLAEAGRLSLDDDLSSAIPAFAVRSRFHDAPPVTLRALLAHHGGLPSDLLRGMWVDHPRSLAELVEDVRDESLASPPQALYRYSNLGFGLLGRAVEIARARPFAEAMQDDILGPLGMVHSSFGAPAAGAGELAIGHSGGRAARPLGLRDAPAGGLISCASDLARFLRFVLSGGRAAGGARVVGEAALEAMFRPQFPGRPLDLGHEVGLGFQLSGVSAAGRSAAWHTGNYPGYYAAIVLLRDERLGAAVLANAQEGGVVLDLAREAVELAVEARRGAPPPVPAPPAAPYRATAGELASWPGRYVVMGELTELRRDGDRLQVHALGTDLDLAPAGPDRLRLEKRLLFGLIRVPLGPLELERVDVDGRALAVVRGTPAPLPFERVEPKPLPMTWRARLGRYEVVDAADEPFALRDVRLEEDAGALVLRVEAASAEASDAVMVRRMALAPADDDEAVVVGLGIGEGATVRALPGPGAALRYSGFRLVRAGAGGG